MLILLEMFLTPDGETLMCAGIRGEALCEFFSTTFLSKADKKNCYPYMNLGTHGAIKSANDWHCLGQQYNQRDMLFQFNGGKRSATSFLFPAPGMAGH